MAKLKMDKEVKEWKKLNFNEYQLFIKNSIVGEIRLDFKKDLIERGTSFIINNEKYLIRNTGPWENTFIIHNQNRNVLLFSVFNKWFNKSFSIEYKNLEYHIVYKSLPAPGWYLIHNNRKIASYSFGRSDEIILEQFCKAHQYALIFDFILIYLMHN